MAWGAWDKSGNNWFRVGTATSISGRRVTVQYKIQSRYNPVNDNQTMNLDGKYSGGQIINFHNGGGTITVATRSWTGSYGSTYTIGCHAYGIYNGATPSHSERVKIPARKPGRVSRPRVTSINNNGGIARWSAPASNGARINRYQVSWSQSSSGTGRVYSSGGGARSQSNRENWGNTTYYVKVRAHNSAGWGGWSPARGFTTKSDRPAAPTNVQANYVSDTTAKVTWTHHGSSTAPYDSQRVQLKYTLENGSWSSWRTVATVGKSARSWTGTGIMAPGAQHRYRVQAINETGSAVSGESSTIRSRPLPPGTPSARKTSGDDIEVKWSRGNRYSDYIDYQVQDNPDGSGWVTVASNIKSLTWVHSSPDPAKTHRYRIRVRDTYRSANRYSGWSSASNTVQLQAPPKAPSRVGPEGVLDRDDGFTLEFRHNPVDTSDQTEAEVRWRFNDGGWTTEHLTGATHTLTVPAIGQTGTVEWQARTRGDDPEYGPWSPKWAFEIVSRPIATINEPSSPILPQSQVTVTWAYTNEDGAPQTRWQAELEEAESGYTLRNASGRTETEHKFDVVLDDETEYIVHVRVYSASGLWSEWISQWFETDFPLPVEVTPEPTWGRENASVGLSFYVPEAVQYNWTGEPHASTTERTGTAGMVTNLVTNPRGRDTSGTVVLRENLCTNPSAEYGMTSQWSGGGTATVDSAHTYFGTASFRLDHTTGNCYRVELTATSGVTYTYSAYVWAPVGDKFTVRIGGSGFISEESAQYQGNGDWQRVSLTATASADGTMAIYPAFQASGQVWVDGIQIEHGSVLHDYGDGDTTATDSDLTWVWAGTPGNSVSQLTAPEPVGWTGAYYSTSRDALAMIDTGPAIFTLDADPGEATLVTWTPEGTVQEEQIGTTVEVSENYFRAAVVDVAGYRDEWFDGDLQSRSEAEWIEVQRILEDGTTRTIADNLDPLTSMTDPLPALYGPTCYQVISHTSLPTSYKGAPQCVIGYDASRPCPPLEREWPEQYETINGDPEGWQEVVINQGDGYQTVVIGGFDLTINDGAIGRRERTLVQYFGRRYPEEHTGQARQQETSLSVSMPVSRVEAEKLGVSPYEDWLDLAYSSAPFWYRDYQGRYHQVSLGEPSVDNSEYGWRTLSMTLTRVNEVAMTYEEA